MKARREDDGARPPIASFSNGYFENSAGRVCAPAIGTRTVRAPLDEQGLSSLPGIHYPKADAVSASPFLLVGDVAEMLGCSVRTIHERARLGEIPHRKPSGARRLLFTESELQAWLDGAELDRLELPRGGRVVKPKGANHAA